MWNVILFWQWFIICIYDGAEIHKLFGGGGVVMGSYRGAEWNHACLAGHVVSWIGY